MVPPPLRKKNPFIIFSPSGCLALFSSFRGVRGIKLNDPSKNSSDDQDWSYPWRAWVLLSSALLWLLSCFMHKWAKLRMSQKRTMLWGQCAILPAAREEPHGNRPSDRGSFGKWSVPHLCCQMQRGRGCGGVAVFDLLSVLQHCSPHREQRAEGLLAGLLSKAREPGWVQTPLLWGTVWLSA